MTSPDMHALSNDLVVLSARLVREIRRRSRDLPTATTRLLSLLDEHGPSTVGALAAADRCSQPTMTGLVNGLVERGWARRAPNPADARSTLVSLTAAGQRTLADVRRRNADLVAERLGAARRSTAELATAVAVLTDALGDAEPDPEGR